MRSFGNPKSLEAATHQWQGPKWLCSSGRIPPFFAPFFCAGCSCNSSFTDCSQSCSATLSLGKMIHVKITLPAGKYAKSRMQDGRKRWAHIKEGNKRPPFPPAHPILFRPPALPSPNDTTDHTLCLSLHPPHLPLARSQRCSSSVTPPDRRHTIAESETSLKCAASLE
jgi:hypothetical protein